MGEEVRRAFRIPRGLVTNPGLVEGFCFCMAGGGPTVCIYISTTVVLREASCLPGTGRSGVERDRRLAGCREGLTGLGHCLSAEKGETEPGRPLNTLHPKPQSEAELRSSCRDGKEQKESKSPEGVTSARLGDVFSTDG